MFVDHNRIIKFQRWHDSIQLHGIQVTHKRPLFIYLTSNPTTIWYNNYVLSDSNVAVETFLLHIFFKINDVVI